MAWTVLRAGEFEFHIIPTDELEQHRQDECPCQATLKHSKNKSGKDRWTWEHNPL